MSTKPRVLLVSTNRERAPQPVVPNGVACVASALRDAGHDVRVLDLCFARDPLRAARTAARAFAPDVIGVSVRNIDNSDLIALRHYTPEAAAVTQALRHAAPQASVIAGGAAFGVAPAALTDALGVDWAVAGDGERATVALDGLHDLPGGALPCDGSQREAEITHVPAVADAAVNVPGDPAGEREVEEHRPVVRRDGSGNRQREVETARHDRPPPRTAEGRQHADPRRCRQRRAVHRPDAVDERADAQSPDDDGESRGRGARPRPQGPVHHAFRSPRHRVGSR